MADKVINIGNSDNKVTVNVTDKIVCPTFDGTATKVGHKLSFGNKTFDGSSTVVLSGVDLGSVDLTSEQTIIGQKTFSGETYLDSLNANIGLISGNLRVINGIAGNLTGNVTGNLSGNASTATKLQTARTLTIGNTGKSFDGSSNVSWTLSEIGAASSSHTHNYLPLTGGLLTGNLGIKFGDTDKFITWDYDGDDSAGASWRIGTKGTRSGNANYFCIESGTNDINTSNWNNVLNIGQNDFTVYFSQTPKVGSTNVSLEGHTHSYLPLSGGTMTGSIILKGGTSTDMTYGGNVHPYIRFDNSNSSKNVSLIFTDYDTYRAPAGIKLVGNQGNEWFEAPNIHATTFYGNLSGNATSATSLGSGALKHMCSLYATNTYNAYKITTDWHKSNNAMPTINIRGYAYGSVRTIDCDIVMYHYDNAACNYSLTNKGSYPIKVWQAIENDVQVFYINPGAYFGMFNVFVYGGMSTGAFSNWSMITVDEVSGTEIYQNPIATSITGNAATATNVAWSGVTNKPNFVNSFGTKTGDITIRGGQTGNGSVNLAMSNNELQASIVGLGSNAYTSTAYLPLAGGTLTGTLTLPQGNSLRFGNMWYHSDTWDIANVRDNLGITILNAAGKAGTSAPSPYAIGLSVSGYYSMQIAAYGGGGDFWIRAGKGKWEKLYHTGNLSPMTTSHPANSITQTNINNWNAVHTWYTTATADDTTNTIDTWKEIEAFVSSFNKGDNLATYLANNYLAKSGGTMSGQLSIQTQNSEKSSPVSQQLVINGPNYDANATLTLQAYPGIGFHMPSRTWASLIWNGNFTGVNSSFDGYVSFYGSGFKKDNSSDNYVLLGGGGHKALSDFSMTHSHPYLPLAGGTMTGTLIISGISTSDWTEGIRINNATNGWSTLTLGGTANSGTGSDIWSLHTYNSNFYLNNNGSNAQQATRLWGHSNGYTIGNTSISANTLAVGGTFRATSSITGDTSISAGTTVTAGTSVTSTAGDFYVGGTSGLRCHIKMDTTNKCIKFIFD